MSQKTDNMIKLALVFFISLLSFSIGTYVGKKYSDNQHKLSLLEPKKEIPTHKTEEFASDVSETERAHGLADGEVALDEQKPAALTDSEVAKIAEEFASEEATSEEQLVATIDPQEKDLKTITDMPEHKKVVAPTAKTAVKNMALKPKQTEINAEERVPASITPKKNEIVPMHFTVQIGAFPTEAEAAKLTKELQSKGYKTSFLPAKINGQIWFRVNVGLFGSAKEAQDYKKEFLQKTKLTSAIVQRVLQ